MRTRINPEHVIPFIAVTLTCLFVGTCAIQLSNDEAGDTDSMPISQTADPFAAKLLRCQGVTADRPAELEECRRVWAENRRRFLTSTKPNWSSSEGDKPSELGTKYQDRILPPEIANVSSGGK